MATKWNQQTESRKKLQGNDPFFSNFRINGNHRCDKSSNVHSFSKLNTKHSDNVKLIIPKREQSTKEKGLKSEKFNEISYESLFPSKQPKKPSTTGEKTWEEKNAFLFDYWKLLDEYENETGAFAPKPLALNGTVTQNQQRASGKPSSGYPTQHRRDEQVQAGRNNSSANNLNRMNNRRRNGSSSSDEEKKHPRNGKRIPDDACSTLSSSSSEEDIRQANGNRKKQMAPKREKIAEKKVHSGMILDSCDTLADVDMIFEDMRTCGGPCKGFFPADQLETFECTHAICGECLNESTDIEIQNGKFSCPVSTCRHGNAERNAPSMKEYAYLKQNYLRSHKIKYSPKAANLTNSNVEASLSIADILQFEQKNATAKSTENSSNESETFGTPKIISGTTLAAKLSNKTSSSIAITSPDFYDEEETFKSDGPATNPFIAVTDSDCDTAKKTDKKSSSAAAVYPINASKYDDELVAELQALSCQTAKPCFTEDDFDDCTTAQTFAYPH